MAGGHSKTREPCPNIWERFLGSLIRAAGGAMPFGLDTILDTNVQISQPFRYEFS